MEELTQNVVRNFSRASPNASNQNIEFGFADTMDLMKSTGFCEKIAPSVRLTVEQSTAKRVFKEEIERFLQVGIRFAFDFDVE